MPIPKDNLNRYTPEQAKEVAEFRKASDTVVQTLHDYTLLVLYLKFPEDPGDDELEFWEAMEQELKLRSLLVNHRGHGSLTLVHVDDTMLELLQHGPELAGTCIPEMVAAELEERKREGDHDRTA